MKKILIYTTRYCGYCFRAKELLLSKSQEFEEIDVTDNQTLRQEVSQKYNYFTVPMIIINDQFIGGASELYQYDAEGKLS